jgi:hypothetical protein
VPLSSRSRSKPSKGASRQQAVQAWDVNFGHISQDGAGSSQSHEDHRYLNVRKCCNVGMTETQTTTVG